MRRSSPDLGRVGRNAVLAGCFTRYGHPLTNSIVLENHKTSPENLNPEVRPLFSSSKSFGVGMV